MVNYNCKTCSFTTKNKRNFIQHTETKKHLIKVTKDNVDNIHKTTPDETKSDGSHMDPIWIPYGSSKTGKISENSNNLGNLDNLDNFGKRNYICDYCKYSFSGANNLARHKKTCTVKKDTEHTYEAKFKEMQSKIDILENDNKHNMEKTNYYIEEMHHYKEETNYYKHLLQEAGGLVKKSVSALTFVVNNYDEAPAIEAISMQEITDFKSTEKEIVNDILSAYKHKTLGKYLGDFIIKIYKKENPEDQSIWNTDDSRLTYLIKELMGNKSSNWIVDKKGIKTQTYIIEPLLLYIKNLIVSYQTHFVIPELGQNSVELEFILENNRKVIELMNDIDDGYVSKEILKHISSHLRFSSKIIENAELKEIEFNSKKNDKDKLLEKNIDKLSEKKSDTVSSFSSGSNSCISNCISNKMLLLVKK